MTCSFCGKHQHDVRTLIAGPAANICDACVQLCVDVLAEQAVPHRRHLREMRALTAELDTPTPAP